MGFPSGSELAASGYRILVDLSLGGQVYRFSTEPLAIVNKNAQTLLYRAGLKIGSVDWSLDTGGDPRSIAITIVSGVDWYKIVEKGGLLEGASVIVRQWVPGQTLEYGRVILRGLTREAEYADPDDPRAFTFSVEGIPWEDTAIIPPEDAVVSASTWPQTSHYAGGTFATFSSSYGYDPQIEGQAYPIPIGRPGKPASFAGSAWVIATKPGSPALLVEAGGGAHIVAGSFWLIALGAVKATSVRIMDVSANKSNIIPVVQTRDNLGRLVSIATLNGITSSAWLQPWVNHEYHTAWTDSSGGGITDVDGTEIRGLGHLLQWLLLQSGVRVDKGRTAAARTYLDRFRIDGYINGQTRILDWIRSMILPTFPVALAESEAGWYPFPLRWDATKTDVVCSLSADRGQIAAAGGAKFTGWNKVYNAFTLDYSANSSTGVFEYRRTLDALADSSRNQIAAFQAARSQTMGWGRRPLPTLTSRLIGEVETADLVLQSKALRHAFPRIQRAYTGPRELANLEAGAILSITDSKVGWTNRLCMLERPAISARNSVTLGVITLDDPPQTSRYTGV